MYLHVQQHNGLLDVRMLYSHIHNGQYHVTLPSATSPFFVSGELSIHIYCFHNIHVPMI